MTGPRFNPNLLDVPLYIAGKSIEAVKEELGLKEITKLASNESPIGPSPQAIEAARSLLEQAHRYPGVLDRTLRRTLAERLNPPLQEDNFVTGNGGTDILRMITQAFIFDGGNTVMCRTTFPMYKILTTTFGGESKIVEPAPDYRHDLTAMAEHIDDDTRLVFLCSPNNPTGHIISHREAENFLDRVPPHVVVVFDESYYDYVGDPAYANTPAFIREGRNVLAVRSFSKAGGLANLRIGCLIGPVELADYVRHTRLPFHTGDIALAAALASLDDEVFLARQKQAVQAGRAYLLEALTGLGLKCLSSQANFVTFYDPPLPAASIVASLLHLGFIVREMTAFGMPNAIRVSAGTQEENAKFIEAMQTVLAGEHVHA
ncbi:MAG TPA: histidinol-phosphate transaminase [Anaerolineales bacterium]|nr:histidinol-phosphate transaminase [Anaerolineales bacterium]